MEDVDNNTRDGTIKYLIGNFSDMGQQRKVAKDSALDFIREKNIDHYIETSAKTGENVTDVFDTAIKHLYLKSKDRKDTEESNYYDPVNHKSRASFPITRPSFKMNSLEVEK